MPEIIHENAPIIDINACRNAVVTTPLPHPSLLRLLQVVSPSLPVGGYSYSQGMEWAVNAGWINSEETCRQWLDEQLDGPVAQQDLPLLARLYQCLEAGDTERAEYWDAMVLAMRETSELRHEEQQRGAALVTLLDVLKTRVLITPRSMVGAFASFCVAERINLTDCLAGNAYSWLDGQVTAAIKLVPLGQSQGQGMLYHSAQRIPSLVASALLLNDDAVGYTSPALAMASCLHETQYTRLFRS